MHWNRTDRKASLAEGRGTVPIGFFFTNNFSRFFCCLLSFFNSRLDRTDSTQRQLIENVNDHRIFSPTHEQLSFYVNCVNSVDGLDFIQSNTNGQ